MNDIPTLFWKLSAWWSDLPPELGLPLAVALGLVFLALIGLGIGYAVEVRKRSPFDPL